MIAFDPVEEEVVFDEEIHNSPMAMTFDGEMLWIGQWNDNRVVQYDLEGNQVGTINLEFSQINGLAADDEGHILMNSRDDNRIHVIDIDDERQVAAFEYRAAMGNADIWNICWVPEHRDGQLWGLANGRVYQVFVDDDWNVEAVQDFAWNSDQQYCGLAHDGENLWHGMWGQRMWYVCEDGVDEVRWVSVEPQTGELEQYDDENVIVILDAANLIGGFYEAGIIIFSNDPDDSEIEITVSLEVEGAPDIDVEWEIGCEHNIINWNEYFEEVFNRGEYIVVVTVLNNGTDVLEIDDIICENDLFYAEPTDFVLDANDEREVNFIFTPEESDEYDEVMVILSNDHDEETLEIQLLAQSFEPPEIIIDPLEIEDMLITGESVEHSFNIFNNGEAVLRWSAEIEVISVPGRDVRDLRSAPPFNSPPGNRGGGSSNITPPALQGSINSSPPLALQGSINSSPPLVLRGSKKNSPPPALRGGSKGGARQLHKPDNINRYKGGARQFHSLNDITQSKGGAQKLPNPEDKILDKRGAPQRDDPGDVLQQFEVPFQSTSGMAWDGELMWGCGYGEDRVIALDPEAGEVVINEEIHDNPMAMTFDGELLWIGLWNDNQVVQYDLEGNRVGIVDLGFDEIAGLAFDEDDHILMNSGDDDRIHVINTDDGREEAVFEYRAAMGNANIYNICWVPEHPDGQLWGLADGRVYQVFVDDDWNAEAVQNFAWNGDEQYCGLAHDGENLWHGMWGQRMWYVCEDGVDEVSWINLEPESGELEREDDIDVFVTIDATGLIGGGYDADVHIFSNDPQNNVVVITVCIEVEGAPDIDVEWEIGCDQNIINWNEYYDEVFNLSDYVVAVTVKNIGTDALEVDDIICENNRFIADPTDFVLEVDEEREVNFIFSPVESGEYAEVMEILSNDPDEEVREIQLVAQSFAPPEIDINPLEIEDNLVTGASAEHSFNITNSGESLLRWHLDIEIISEPEQDARSLRNTTPQLHRESDVRTLRDAPPFDSPPGNRGGSIYKITPPSPRGGSIYLSTPPAPRGGSKGGARRDDPGDIIAEYEVPMNNHSGMAWDGELMWGISYGDQRMVALNPDDGEVVFNERIHNAPLAMAFDGELFWIGEYATDMITRYDLNGDQIDQIRMPFGHITGMAADNNGNMLMNSGEGDRIHIISLENLEEVASFQFRHAMGNADIWSIVWVSDHPQGQLWGLSRGRIYQAFVDDDMNVEAVQNFECGADYQYSIGHDGVNLWHGMWERNSWFVVDDGVAESRWLQTEPGAGELEEEADINVIVTLDAADLIEGLYEAGIHVLSNDPDDEDIEVSVTLEVEGIAAIATEPVAEPFEDAEELEFPDTFVADDENTLAIVIRNVGTDELVIEDVDLTNRDDFWTGLDAEEIIEARESIEFEVGFEPQERGEHEAILHIYTNAENIGEGDDLGHIWFNLRGTGVVHPVIVTEPEAGEGISVAMLPNDDPVERSIIIGNDAGDFGVDLEFNIRIIMMDQWLTIDPREGVVVSGEEQEISLTFNADGLEPDTDFRGELRIMSNDPETPLVAFNIHLDTRGVPVPRDLVVPLARDWNMISINVFPGEDFWEREEGPDIVLMTEQLRIDDDNHHVFIMKDSEGRFYAPEYNFNGIPYWDLTHGYMVKVDQDVEAVWTGFPIAYDQDIPLVQGWNIASYYPTWELDASADDFYVLSSIIDHVIIAKDAMGNFMIPARNFSNMDPWRETQGYQVCMNEAVVLNYPEEAERIGAYYGNGNFAANRGGLTAKNGVNPPRLTLEDSHWQAPPSTGRNMSLLLSLKGEYRFDSGDQVAAFSPSGNLVGLGTIDHRLSTIENRQLCGLAVWGDDLTTDHTDGLLEDEAFTLLMWDAEQGEELNLNVRIILEGEGLIYETDGLTALGVEAEFPLQIPVDFFLSQNYPNPFNRMTKLSFGLPEAVFVSIAVYDIDGRMVERLVDDVLPAGHHTAIWEAGEITAGIYLVRMRTPGFSSVRKVIYVK